MSFKLPQRPRRPLTKHESQMLAALIASALAISSIASCVEAYKTGKPTHNALEYLVPGILVLTPPGQTMDITNSLDPSQPHSHNVNDLANLFSKPKDITLVAGLRYYRYGRAALHHICHAILGREDCPALPVEAALLGAEPEFSGDARYPVRFAAEMSNYTSDALYNSIGHTWTATREYIIPAFLIDLEVSGMNFSPVDIRIRHMLPGALFLPNTGVRTSELYPATGDADPAPVPIDTQHPSYPIESRFCRTGGPENLSSVVVPTADVPEPEYALQERADLLHETDFTLTFIPARRHPKTGEPVPFKTRLVYLPGSEGRRTSSDIYGMDWATQAAPNRYTGAAWHPPALLSGIANLNGFPTFEIIGWTAEGHNVTAMTVTPITTAMDEFGHCLSYSRPIGPTGSVDIFGAL